MTVDDEKNAAKERIQKMVEQIDSTDSNKTVVCKNGLNKFFDFGTRKKTNNEYSLYLQTETLDMDSLKKFPSLTKLFIKYNSALPSSASVERLFSAGGLILTALRNRLTDKNFEQHLLLKTNKKYQAFH